MKTMTKQGSTAHGFLKITDSGLECIPFTSTGVTLFMYPINLIDHCLSKLSCTQLQPFPFSLKRVLCYRKVHRCLYSTKSFSSRCIVLGVFCVKIRLNYSADTTSRIPWNFLLQQDIVVRQDIAVP